MFLCVAAAVKLTSRGPVFFRQQRVGEAGLPFTMFKFRTMQVNADHRIHQEYVEKFIQSNQAAGSGTGAVFKLVNDPRVTLVGDFCAGPASTNSPSSGTCCAATCPWLGRGRRCRMRWRAISDGTGGACSKRSQASPASASDGAEPDDVRRHGAARPALREEPFRCGPI